MDVKGDRMVGTPLHYAENKEVADLLIAKGADVNAKGGRVGLPCIMRLLKIIMKWPHC